MGGYGSGRRGGASKKIAVEDCLTLDVVWMKRIGLLECAHGDVVRGGVTWTRGDREIGAVSYTLNNVGEIVLALAYNLRGEVVRDCVRMQITRPNYGGVRLWGTCPNCGRRIAKLHLPPGGRHFACRKCWGLSYRSAQEAHMFDDLYRFMAAALSR